MTNQEPTPGQHAAAGCALLAFAFIGIPLLLGAAALVFGAVTMIFGG